MERGGPEDAGTAAVPRAIGGRIAFEGTSIADGVEMALLTGSAPEGRFLAAAVQLRQKPARGLFSEPSPDLEAYVLHRVPEVCQKGRALLVAQDITKHRLVCQGRLSVRGMSLGCRQGEGGGVPGNGEYPSILYVPLRRTASSTYNHPGVVRI